jgi:hypothetical protein
MTGKEKNFPLTPEKLVGHQAKHYESRWGNLHVLTSIPWAKALEGEGGL